MFHSKDMMANKIHHISESQMLHEAQEESMGNIIMFYKNTSIILGEAYGQVTKDKRSAMFHCFGNFYF